MVREDVDCISNVAVVVGRQELLGKLQLPDGDIAGAVDVDANGSGWADLGRAPRSLPTHPRRF